MINLIAENLCKNDEIATVLNDESSKIISFRV